MATYYWVGGSGTWDGATTTNWALSSGGAGGAGVPTAADNANFDALSGTSYTVTINAGAVCNDLTAVGTASATLSLTASATLNVYGSLTFPATGLTWAGGASSSVFFLATATGKTVTTNGVSLGTSTSVRFDGAGGGWTLGSAITCNNLTVNQGSFTTGNFAVTLNSTFTGSSTLTRSVSLGSSTVTIAGASPWTFTTTTNLAFSAGTSTITCSATSPAFSGGGLTYNNVSFTSTGSGTTTITGSNTFNNLTQSSRSATGIRIVVFAVSQTVTGTLTLGATNTAIRRVVVFGTTTTGTGVGTPVTLTVNAIATLADVDFRDIIAAGASGTWSGTRLGNCGGNTNITFAAGVTKYWSLAAGGNWSATAWALTSGGAPAVNNFPLAQDSVVISNTNLNAGTTITIDASWQIPAVDASTRTNTLTLAGSVASYWYGNITLYSALTWTNTGAANIVGPAQQTITSAGVALTSAVTVLNSAGGLTLNGNLTTTGTLTVTQGAMNLAGYTFTCPTVAASGSGVRTLAFGAGKFSLTGNATTVWNTSTTTNLTITGTPLVELTYAGSTGNRQISPGVLTESTALSFSILAGTDTVTFIGSGNTVKNLLLSGFTGTFSESVSQTLYGNITLSSGMTFQQISTITFGATSGTQTITSNGVAFGCAIVVNAPGATVAMADALTMASRAVTLTSGSFVTNGYALSALAVQSSGTATRVINLGASTVTVTSTGTAWSFATSTGATVIPGTSNIVFTATTAACTFAGGGLTYAGLTTPAGSGYNFSITGANTFNTLSITAPLNPGRRAVILNSDTVITGTLAGSGAAGNARNRLVSPSVGTSVVLTVASAPGLSDVDFQDITIAGAASPLSGTRLGDLGGNTNIVFAGSKTVYWNKPAGGNWGDDAWALTSGGAVSTNNFPLGQDVVVLDDTGIGAGTTIAMQYGWAFGGLTASTLTNALTIDWTLIQSTGANAIRGNIALSAALTFTGSAVSTVGFDGRRDGSVMTVTSAGVIWSQSSVLVSSVAPYVVRLQDDLTTGASTTFSLRRGTLDLNGRYVNTTVFDSAPSPLATRSIAFNGGQINITGSNNTVWNIADLTDFSYTGTPTVNFTYSGSTGTRTINNGATAGATELNVVDIHVTSGTDTFTAVTGSSVGTLDYTGFSGVGTTIAAGYIYGNLTLSATQTLATSTSVTTFAATSGVKTITTNGVLVDRAVVFGGVGGTWSLQSALTIGNDRAMGLFAGTLNTNGYSVSCGRFNASDAGALGARTLNLGASTFTCVGTSAATMSWQIETTTYPLTLNAGTSTIQLAEAYTGVSTQDFIGGGKTYYSLVYSGNQPSTFYGNNIFNSITVSAHPIQLSFDAGSTQTVNQFNVSGTVGNITTLSSLIPGSQWYLAKNTGGKVLVSNCTISDSAATPAGYWFAPTSQGNVNAGNNTGWNFASDGQNSGFMLLI